MTSTALERVRVALEERDCRVTGTKAQCPAHTDRSPSLSVTWTDGRVLIKCHAGCATKDVLVALNLAWRDLYDEPLPRLARSAVREHPYRRLDGSLIGVAQRLEPKTFRPLTRDGNRWAHKATDELKNTPYDLPELAEAVKRGKTIYVTEGEHDAETLTALGLAATCNQGGAEKWTPRHAQWLKGVDVVVIRDANDAGLAHAKVVVASLKDIAKSVQVLVPPEAVDVTEHLESGRTLDDLVPEPELVDDGAAEPWGTPEPIAKNAKIPLPASTNRRPGKLWAMVDAVAVSYQVPRDLPFLLILAILATCVGGRRRVRVAPDWSELLVLYTAIALPSGERKSPVFAAATAPLLAVELDLQAQAEPEIAVERALRDLRSAAVEKIKRSGKTDATTIADLESAVRELESTVVRAVPRLLADDSTPEKMAVIMHEQGGRLGVLSAEGGLFSILAGRYSSGVPNLDLVLKAWSGDRAQVDRISREQLTIHEPALSVGLAVQPPILAGLAESKQFRGAGLLARFLFSLPTSLVGTRKSDESTPVPLQVSNDYSAAVTDLARTIWATEKATEIDLSEAARKVLNKFRDELEPRLHPDRGDLSHIADWANKLPGQLVRIAALFALFVDPSIAKIAENDMAQAIELAPYFIGHALDAFELMSGRRSPLEPARAVLTWIQRKDLKSFTVRQAKRELAGQAWVEETDDVREAIVDLEDLGWVRPQPEPEERQRGRPSERYDVNPAAHQAVIGIFGNAPERLREAS